MKACTNPRPMRPAGVISKHVNQENSSGVCSNKILSVPVAPCAGDTGSFMQESRSKYGIVRFICICSNNRSRAVRSEEPCVMSCCS